MAFFGCSDTQIVEAFASSTPSKQMSPREDLAGLNYALAADKEHQAAGVTKSSRILNAAEEPFSTRASSTYRIASRKAGSRLSSSGLV